MPAAAATIQQDFDAAQAKLDAQDFYGARNAFTALLARFPAGANGKAVSVVRARLANALIATNDPEAAIGLLETAFPGLKPATVAEVALEATAHFDLGRAREATGAIDAAARDYQAAMRLKAFPVDGAIDIGMRASLARTLIWSDPAEARRLLDALLGLPPSQLSGESRALVLSLRGRVELNNSKPAEAKRWLQQAAEAAGGDSTRSINVADMRIRGDLALANYALGDMKEVSRVMHFAGAGGDLPMIFSKARNTALPGCAPLTGLAPDTVAVIEFALGSDGRVASATPIYARLGAGLTRTAEDKGPESLFTEAVRGWYWPADSAREIPAFWRQAIRVELRCLNQRMDDEDWTASRFRQDFAAAYTVAGIAPLPEWSGNAATTLPLIAAELARRERDFSSASPQLLPVLLALAGNNAASAGDRLTAIARWQNIVASVPSVAPLAPLLQLTKAYLTGNKSPHPVLVNREIRRQMAQTLAETEAKGAGNTRAAMAVRLALANYSVAADDRRYALQLYNAIAVAPESVLPIADPLRIEALVRAADLAARNGDLEGASNALAATGLAPEQCALVDVRPQKVNGTISEDEFPQLAKDWGNSGYVRTGFDITVDGKPRDVRTVIASPPFIFGPDTEKAVARFRYSPVFRPGNTVGCTAQTQSVRFQ